MTSRSFRNEDVAVHISAAGIRALRRSRTPAENALLRVADAPYRRAKRMREIEAACICALITCGLMFKAFLVLAS